MTASLIDSYSGANRPDAAGDVNYTTMHRLSQQYCFPAYVKQADPQETLTPEGLPAGAYADTVCRLFPCHTKAACFISNLFLLENRDRLTVKQAARVADNLQRAAARLGILPDVEAAREKHASFNKAAESQLPDSAFAIVWHDSEGHKDRRYPLRNGLEVQAAAKWFSDYRDEFLFRDRQTIANKLLDKAAEFSVKLPDELDVLLEKQAGRGVCDPAVVAEQLRRRAALRFMPPGMKDRLEKLASDWLSQPLLAEDLATTSKLAEVVDEIDRRCHLTTHYDEALQRPEDFVFAGVVKHAAEFVQSVCPTLSGSIYEKNQFSKLSVATVRHHFGEDIAQAVTTGLRVDGQKMAQVAASLPLPDAVSLDRLMQAVGQAPVRTKAAGVGDTAAERNKAAAEYAISSQGATLSGVMLSGVRGSSTV